MIIRGKGVDYTRVVEIINSVSNSMWDGDLILDNSRALGGKNPNYGFTGRIRAKTSGDRCARRSWTGRRGNAACWHAWRDVIRAILTEYPNAVVTTAQARYEGLTGFEETYPGTANNNVGSMMHPAFMTELCECGDWEG